MKFLIDVCVSENVAEFLKSEGHEIAFVVENDPSMADQDILGWASREGFALVTNDKDFGRYVFLHHQSHAGLIRLPSSKGDIQVALMRQVLANHREDLSEGAVITASRERIRIRKL